MHIPSLKDSVSPDEWQLRCDLAACYRLVAAYGWSDLVFTHISARVPGPDHSFLINPYGLMFDEVEELSTQLNTAIQKFNDLATNYNSVVKDLNEARSKSTTTNSP